MTTTAYLGIDIAKRKVDVALARPDGTVRVKAGPNTPAGYTENIRKKFMYAGETSADAVDRFLAIRVLTVAMIPVSWWLIIAFVPESRHQSRANVTLAAAVK